MTIDSSMPASQSFTLEPNEPNKRHERHERQGFLKDLWDMGPGIFVHGLLSFSLKKDHEALHAFLDAAETGVLTDAGPRMASPCKLFLDEPLLALFPDRRKVSVVRGSRPIKLSATDALAVAFHSLSGADAKAQWCHLVSLDNKELGLLERALSVLKTHHSAEQPSFANGVAQPDELGSGAFCCFLASMVGNCRDPVAMALVLAAIKGSFVMTRHMSIRTDFSESQQDSFLCLADLSLAKLNPAAINALMDVSEASAEQGVKATARAFLLTESPLNQMVSQIVMPLQSKGIPVDFSMVLKAMRDEFTAGQHFHNASMTRAVKRLVNSAQCASPLLGAAIHSLFLRQACYRQGLSWLETDNSWVMDSAEAEANDAVFSTLWELRKVSGVPLTEWYAQAKEEAARTNFEQMSPQMEPLVSTLVSAVAQAAAINARHEVLEELGPALTALLKVERNDKHDRNGKDSTGESHVIGSLFHCALMEMCSSERVIPFDRFLKTVEALQACGYDHTDTLPHATGDTEGSGVAKGDTTLHLLARLPPSDLQLPAMEVLLKIGADPRFKNARGRTPASALKSRGLDAKWLQAVRSHEAQVQARAAMDEIKVESRSKALPHP